MRPPLHVDRGALRARHCRSRRWSRHPRLASSRGASTPRRRASRRHGRRPDAPRHEWERILGNLWSEILMIHGIKRTDDFFAIGGSTDDARRMLESLRAVHGVRGHPGRASPCAHDRAAGRPDRCPLGAVEPRPAEDRPGRTLRSSASRVRAVSPSPSHRSRGSLDRTSRSTRCRRRASSAEGFPTTPSSAPRGATSG